MEHLIAALEEATNRAHRPLGVRLTEWMSTHGYTTPQVAKMAGYSERTISRAKLVSGPGLGGYARRDLEALMARDSDPWIEERAWALSVAI